MFPAKGTVLSLMGISYPLSWSLLRTVSFKGFRVLGALGGINVRGLGF